MTPDLFAAAVLFALASVITPGPNNVMLLASGANFGLRRTLPHMAGVAFGVPLMVMALGLGVMRLFALWPPLETVLTVAFALYLLWLAWKIATAAPPDEAAAKARPLTFLQALLFQWINPKAWTMTLGAITLYATARDLAALATVAAIFVAAGCLSTTTWVLLGTQIRRLLRKPRHLRAFNIAMAIALVAATLPALIR